MIGDDLHIVQTIGDIEAGPEDRFRIGILKESMTIEQARARAANRECTYEKDYTASLRGLTADIKLRFGQNGEYTAKYNIQRKTISAYSLSFIATGYGNPAYCWLPRGRI
jgi:hypothetical protein